MYSLLLVASMIMLTVIFFGFLGLPPDQRAIAVIVVFLAIDAIILFWRWHSGRASSAMITTVLVVMNILGTFIGLASETRLSRVTMPVFALLALWSHFVAPKPPTFRTLPSNRKGTT